MRIELFCFSLFFLPLQAGLEVHGGFKTTIEKYPFITRLSIGENHCTGSLVTKSLILTADHCFYDQDDNSFIAHGIASFHDTDYFNKQEKGEFTRTIAHVKSYKNFDNSDLALARLSKKVEGIRPVKLNGKRFMIGSSMRTVGYGWHAPKSSPYHFDGHLREIILKISFVNGTFIGTKVGKNMEGPCSGDSGAPLLIMAKNQWSVLATLKGYGYDCRDETVDADHPDDVWSSVKVIKSEHLRKLG